MKRGFNASTAILVVLLIGILFAVGKVVNPPVKGGHDDHDHDQESAAAAPAKSPPPPTKMPAAPAKGTAPSPMTDRQKMEATQREHMAHTNPSAKSASANDGMDASYWQENNMGAVTPKPTAVAH